MLYCYNKQRGVKELAMKNNKKEWSEKKW